MHNEKYIFTRGEKGAESLGTLDTLFNPKTEAFLKHVGLKEGMTVLDIGCGSGVMTYWIAQQIGKKGQIVAIENDESQLNAAKSLANKHEIHVFA